MKYRKKPVVIEARRCHEPADPDDIARWCHGKLCGVGAVGEKIWIEIDTLEGVMRADYGDWIIQGVNGEFYPCKPDIFEKTYEKVTDDAPAVFTAADLAAAREEGRRDGIEKAKTLFRNEHDFTDTKAWNLICVIKTLDNALALLAEPKLKEWPS